MRNFKIMISIFMLAVSFASMSAAKKSTVRKTSGKKTTVKKVVKKEEEKSPMIGMSNPASVYCVEQGGESILVRSKKGDFGICKLKDGTAVEEWEYYRENNKKEQKNNIKNRVQKYESVAMYFITLFFIIMKIVYYLILKY